MFSVFEGFRKSTIIKVVSIVLIQAFLFYNVGFTQPYKTVSVQDGSDTLVPYSVSQLVLNEKAIKKLDNALARLA